MGQGGEGAFLLKEFADQIHEQERLPNGGNGSYDCDKYEGENKTPAASRVPKQPGVKWFH